MAPMSLWRASLCKSGCGVPCREGIFSTYGISPTLLGDIRVYIIMGTRSRLSGRERGRYGTFIPENKKRKYLRIRLDVDP
jgi:hypothetical protein